MEYSLSKSEKKRRAKKIEQLAVELVSLSPTDIKKLPCDDFIKNEILACRDLKAGARKRQIKYLTKNLRDIDSGPLYDFMSDQKGSSLKENKEFHELENIRDNIINEAISAARDARQEQLEFERDWYSETLETAVRNLPDLDEDAVRQLAWRYIRGRKAAQSREIFRLLKAASERKQWQNSKEK
ncbi:MAG: DUF615 domain-containing protein [Desulfobulbaceae bacterium]|nr:DUF615 domain-containing protein [Desulfobulbaceae bacterium]